MTTILLKTDDSEQLFDLPEVRIYFDKNKNFIRLTTPNNFNYYLDEVNGNLRTRFNSFIENISNNVNLIVFDANTLHSDYVTYKFPISKIFDREIKLVSEVIIKEIENKKYVTPMEIIHQCEKINFNNKYYSNMELANLPIFFNNVIYKGEHHKTVPELINNGQIKNDLQLDNVDIVFTYLNGEIERSYNYKIYFKSDVLPDPEVLLNDEKIIDSLKKDICIYHKKYDLLEKSIIKLEIKSIKNDE